MDSSILTNASAMTALQNLSATQTALNTTQAQISSGLRIATASDNAAYWSIATTLTSDKGALSAVSDALSLGTSIVSTSTAAIASTLTLLNRIKADLVTARQPGTSLASVQTDISAQQRSLVSVLSSASFNGVNLLDGSVGTSPPAQDDGDDDDGDDDPDDEAMPQSLRPSFGPARPIDPIGHPIGQPIIGPVTELPLPDTTLAFVTSFRRTSGGTALGTVTLDTATTNLVGSGGVLNGSPGGSGSTNIIGLDITAPGVDLVAIGADVDAAIASVTAAGALIGEIGTTLVNQNTYVAALSDALASGVGSLVDADMNVASTRLQALWTQQRLGLQALSIANQNSAVVLKLFAASA